MIRNRKARRNYRRLYRATRGHLRRGEVRRHMRRVRRLNRYM